MNERIEYCLYQAGLTAQGCWNELDDYAKEAIQKFAELIVKECIDIADKAEPYKSNDLIRQHFGVEE